MVHWLLILRFSTCSDWSKLLVIDSLKIYFFLKKKNVHLENFTDRYCKNFLNKVY